MNRSYPDNASRIAEKLVYDYPDHGFVIDPDEGRSIGLNIERFSPQMTKVVEEMLPHLGSFTAIGQIIERDQEDERQASA